MISENQLDTWSHIGAQVISKNTHESIRNCINSYDFKNIYNYEDYLQGSYKNSTNIRSESDVDIVIQLNSTFLSDLTYLTDEQRRLYNNKYPNSSISLDDFKNEVFQCLKDNYGSNVETSNKAIKIRRDEHGNRLNADVIVALQYRKYLDINVYNDDFIEGIYFVANNGNAIINYPKLHYDYGLLKNKSTNSVYKNIIRIFKNMRTSHGNSTSSYFIECLLFNVPDNIYNSNSTFQGITTNVFEWLIKNISSYKFKCQNNIIDLFGNGQWDLYHAMEFITNMCDYYLKGN